MQVYWRSARGFEYRCLIMMFYDYYADVPEQTQNEFVNRQELGRLVTVNAEGQPHIGLYPFLFLGAAIEMHLHRSDEQFADLRANRKCAFEVDEIHGTHSRRTGCTPRTRCSRRPITAS